MFGGVEFVWVLLVLLPALLAVALVVTLIRWFLWKRADK